MNINFLYWNINNKSESFISEIKKITSNINILLLVENNNISDKLIEKELGLYKLINYDETPYTPKLYSGYKNRELEYVGTISSKRLIFSSLKFSNTEEILIGGLHFPSKKHYTNSEQLEIAKNYVEEIEKIEMLKNNSKTIIFGDFNMNPFEPGMLEHSAFNATLSENEAKKKRKKFHFRNYLYFYNPMWSFLGDRNNSNGKIKYPGTYYYNKIPYWNVFDKVIMRPDVIKNFDFNSIKIITEIENNKLIDDNFKINDSIYSDHLPLSFTIQI